MKKERDADMRRHLRAEWLRAVDCWRAFCKRDEERSVDDAWRAFFEAVNNKSFYPSWRIARRNLAGKGGGIWDRVTAFIGQDDWESHFANLFSNPGPVLMAPSGGQACRLLDDPFTGDEVASILNGKKTHRALGPDGFCLDHIRILRFDEVTCAALANFFNICVAAADVPHEWEHAFLFILYKGTGPKDNANSFRGIPLKSQLLKLLESLLCARLRKWAENRQLLPNEQIAYRPGQNGSDHLFSLTTIREKAKADGHQLHAAFVDLKKAFPSVNRQRLLNELNVMGVSDKFLRILTRLYSGDTFSVLLDGKPGSRKFNVDSGVHEGSPVSPLLFILFIAGLVEKLKANRTDRCGIRLSDGSWLCCMLYADDVLLLSITREGLQSLIDNTCQFFSLLGLTVNPGKSDIVIFDGGRSANPRQFSVAAMSKTAVNEAKYLGIIFHRGGNWKC
jgi:hypothetical protein